MLAEWDRQGLSQPQGLSHTEDQSLTLIRNSAIIELLKLVPAQDVPSSAYLSDYLKKYFWHYVSSQLVRGMLTSKAQNKVLEMKLCEAVDEQVNKWKGFMDVLEAGPRTAISPFSRSRKFVETHTFELAKALASAVLHVRVGSPKDAVSLKKRRGRPKDTDVKKRRVILKRIMKGDPKTLSDSKRLRSLFGALEHDHIAIPGNSNCSTGWLDLLDDPMREKELEAALKTLRMDFER